MQGMADYIYLLENRLSAAQQSAIRTVVEVARTRGLTVFLVGGAVRDLTSGSPVRDLDVVVQGNALKVKKDLEKAGAVVVGEFDAGQALFLKFPGSVRMEFGSTLSVSYPKPGKAVLKPANILDDLRRRDFTANAMALSLNEGSYGLLMDPLNGVADIENRELRLVSNYGFIEDPVKMIRAARLMARLGWAMDEKTQGRYETGKQEGYISVLSEYLQGYELEEIFHEEDPLRILKKLEAEGWMKYLAPFWTSQKVNVVELERLRDVQTNLQMHSIHPDTAAANFPLLTDKLAVKEITKLKSLFPRQGFVAEIEGLENESKAFATLLGGKTGAAPSQAWKMITSHKPEVVLWTVFSSKSAALQAKFKSFLQEWPQARQKMPYALMAEMRIVPELPGYNELLESLFFELMDGKLTSPEEMRAFLEPFSPPAPPPPQTLRRQRATKKEAKPAKSRSKKAAAPEAEAEDEDLVDADDEVVIDLDDENAAEVLDGDDDESEEEVDEGDEIADVVPKKAVKKAVSAAAKATTVNVSRSAAVKDPAPVKAAPAKKSVAAAPAKKVAAKTVPSAGTQKLGGKTAGKAVAPVKSAPAKKTAAKAVPSSGKKVPAKAAPAVPAKKGKAAALPSKSKVAVKAVAKKGSRR